MKLFTCCHGIVTAFARRRSIADVAFNARARRENRAIFDAKVHLATMPTALLRATGAAVMEALWSQNNLVQASTVARAHSGKDGTTHQEALAQVLDPLAKSAAFAQQFLAQPAVTDTMRGLRYAAGVHSARASRQPVALRPRRR